MGKTRKTENDFSNVKTKNRKTVPHKKGKYKDDFMEDMYEDDHQNRLEFDSLILDIYGDDGF